MTRGAFLEDITTFGELSSFCYDEDCSILENVYDEDGMNEEIDQCLVDWAQEQTWQELCRTLNNIPDGYEWYRRDDWGDWLGLDDGDFEDYKQEVLEWMDNGGYWDDEDEDDDGNDDGYENNDTNVFDEEPCEEQTEDEEPELEDEDFSVGDLFSMSSVTYTAVKKANIHRLQEEDRQFDDFVSVNMPKVLV